MLKVRPKPIDVEFAVTKNGDTELVWLLQARPLNLTAEPESCEAQEKRLKIIENKVSASIGAHPFLLGSRTIFGVMPDWNPAEIVGTRPKPLALSLYRDLITDSIWAYQRHNYGYRNLRSFPLMLNFFGQPYIDVRLSFNSFIPADLEEDIAARLVEYYITRLEKYPEFHDKVEFEVVFSCYAFDLSERLEALLQSGFSKQETDIISQSLLRLTNNVIRPGTGLWRKDLQKLDVLEKRRVQLNERSSNILERIYWLLEDAKRYGTLPFAGLARAGFIATTILKSLVHTGVLSDTEHDRFVAGVSTVNKQMVRDRKILGRSSFLAKYGHLRPGTYDIMSPRYDKAPDIYFDWEKNPAEIDETEPFSFTSEQMRATDALLRAHGLDLIQKHLSNF